MSKISPRWLSEDRVLTTGNRMRKVARTVLLRADVAETARTKGNHSGNPV